MLLDIPKVRTTLERGLGFLKTASQRMERQEAQSFKQLISESHHSVTGHNGMFTSSVEVRNGYLKH